MIQKPPARDGALESDWDVETGLHALRARFFEARLSEPSTQSEDDSCVGCALKSEQMPTIRADLALAPTRPRLNGRIMFVRVDNA